MYRPTIITTITDRGDMFTEPFMQRAFLAALFLAPLCSLLGVFVTARRMAFFSDTVSHAALAGIALGFWLGFANPTLPLILVSCLIAIAVYWLKENTQLLTDTIMALLLSGSVAAGIIMLNMLKGYQGEIQRYLFGDILAVGWIEVRLAAILFVTVGSGYFAFLNGLSLITLEQELAHVCGVPVRRLNYAFVIILTLTVTVTIRLLGIILVTSLLVIPAAAARSLSRNLRQQIILSVIFGLFGSLGGIALSYELDVPSGPVIVLTCIAIFAASVVLGKIRQKGVIPAPV
jgi:zinc transport system permease protein